MLTSSVENTTRQPAQNPSISTNMTNWCNNFPDSRWLYRFSIESMRAR